MMVFMVNISSVCAFRDPQARLRGLGDTVANEGGEILTVRWETPGEKVSSARRAGCGGLPDDASPQLEGNIPRRS
jgi:hypothetical protein